MWSPKLVHCRVKNDHWYFQKSVGRREPLKRSRLCHVNRGSLSSSSRFRNVLSNGMARTTLSIQATHALRSRMKDHLWRNAALIPTKSGNELRSRLPLDDDFGARSSRTCNMFFQKTNQVTIRILLCFELQQIWDHFYYTNAPHLYSKSGLRFAVTQSILIHSGRLDPWTLVSKQES